jgi:hypothetical protein
MRVGKLAIATMAVSLSIEASAQAAPLIVGSPLTGSFTPTAIVKIATIANSELAEPGAQATSPVAGAVIGWNMIGAVGGPFQLRILRPSDGEYIGAGASEEAMPTGLNLQSFPAAIPIQEEDLIALDNSNEKGDKIGTLKPLAGSGLIAFFPPLAEGVAALPAEREDGREVAFNAIVQPAPTVASISPRTGSLKGGTDVTITGTDLTGATAVSFGGIPARRFAVDSEVQATAVTPATRKPGRVDVTVTTVAGTSPIRAVKFRFTACVVPKLKGRQLKNAKDRIRRAGCSVGTVKRRAGVLAKPEKVVRQGRQPGRTLAPGTKVNITLG